MTAKSSEQWFRLGDSKQRVLAEVAPLKVFRGSGVSPLEKLKQLQNQKDRHSYPREQEAPSNEASIWAAPGSLNLAAAAAAKPEMRPRPEKDDINDWKRTPSFSAYALTRTW